MEKRHTENGGMIERMVGIHKEILSGHYPKCRQLAKKFEVSISTIGRDIDYMKNRWNAPIGYNARRRGFYYTEKFDVPTNLVSVKQLLALTHAKTLLSQYEGTPVYDEISSVINFLIDSQMQNNSPLLKRIAVPPSPKISVDEKIWNVVLTAIKQNSILEFDYTGRWRTEKTHRRVRPYQILLDDGVCCLFGFAEERNAVRLFILSSMENVRLTGDTFELPEQFEFSHCCGGGKFGLFATKESSRFTIDFYANARQYVKSCVWADDQTITDFDDEDKTRITFSSTQNLKIREWVLAQGANAVPVAPEWFVDDWKEQVREMAENAGV